MTPREFAEALEQLRDRIDPPTDHMDGSGA